MQVILSNSYGALMLFIWLVAVPVLMGLPFGGLGSEDRKHLRTAWICGYMEMWAAFQLISMIFVLTTGNFYHVVYTYIGLTVLLCLTGFILAFRKKSNFKFDWKALFAGDRTTRIVNLIIWIAATAITVFQLYMSITRAFADGDDAYYIPISLSSIASGKLYNVIPYDGYVTTLDTRHALSPFPVWIAFLSYVSGIHSTIIAHSILNCVLILISYSVYYRIAHLLFRKNKNGVPIFMLLVVTLVTFSNYSFYTVETFMLTRTSQGKSVLGNVVIPFLMLCLLQMGHEFTFDETLALDHRRPNKESNKRKILLGILITTATMAAWLCSTMGAVLSCALLGISGLIIALTYKNIKAIAYALACCLPSMFYIILYLVIS